MNPLVLIHWHAAEAEAHAGPMREAGFAVHVEAEDGGRAARTVRELEPLAVVIYHTRLPSHGRRVAEHLRETKATREIPLLIVGGEGAALQKTREAVPDAQYMTEEELPQALQGLLLASARG